MEKRVTWRYLLILLITIILLIITGDSYLKDLLADQPLLYQNIKPKLLLTGLGLISLTVVVFAVQHQRVTKPINELVTILKQHMDGSFTTIEPLHQSNDISPLLYAIEVILNSYLLQIQDAEADLNTLRSVLNQITDGIVMVNTQGEVSSMNPAAEAIFSTLENQARGRTVAEVLRQHQWIELYRQCRDTSQKTSATLELPSQQIFLQGIAIPPGDNLPGHTLLVFQDLSQLRRLETTRQDFISNISHELRTPLASLKALTDTLQEGALEDPQAARRFLGRMDTELDALTQMVNELLELSRIESGQVPLTRKPTSLSQLLEGVRDRMHTQAKRKNLTIEIELPGNPIEIPVDRRRVEQVLVNLLHNAIKFSDPGERIILSAKMAGDETIFIVQDFGAGIPEPDLDRIFERFYKTDQARTSGGTGLGLSIAKHIIEAHQGRIWAESTYGQGSQFFFSIPLAINQP